VLYRFAKVPARILRRHTGEMKLAGRQGQQQGAWSCLEIRVQESYNIMTGDKSFERVKYFKCLGTALMNENSIQKEIKGRLKSRNACYHSMQKNLSFSLLSKNIKFKIFRTTILSVVLYGCETWSLTLREERRLGVFKNSVLRKIFGPKRDEVTGEWRELHNEELYDIKRVK
jgi:hypothetical protein